MSVKRPRQYATDIIALRTVDERRAALARIPSDWRDWVAFYVRDHFEKRHYLKQRLGGATINPLKR